MMTPIAHLSALKKAVRLNLNRPSALRGHLIRLDGSMQRSTSAYEHKHRVEVI